jgi:hypothetical protein
VLGWWGIFCGGIVGSVGLGGRFFSGSFEAFEGFGFMTVCHLHHVWNSGRVGDDAMRSTSFLVGCNFHLRVSASVGAIGLVVVVSSHLILGFAYSDRVKK